MRSYIAHSAMHSDPHHTYSHASRASKTRLRDKPYIPIYMYRHLLFHLIADSRLDQSLSSGQRESFKFVRKKGLTETSRRNYFSLSFFLHYQWNNNRIRKSARRRFAAHWLTDLRLSHRRPSSMVAWLAGRSANWLTGGRWPLRQLCRSSRSFTMGALSISVHSKEETFPLFLSQSLSLTASFSSSVILKRRMRIRKLFGIAATLLFSRLMYSSLSRITFSKGTILPINIV